MSNQMELNEFCQSCGMPMQGMEEMFGSNKDGSLNPDFCEYCFQEGKYTADLSIYEMINLCIPHVQEAHPEMTEEDARTMMEEFLPTLKRWKKE